MLNCLHEVKVTALISNTIDVSSTTPMLFVAHYYTPLRNMLNADVTDTKRLGGIFEFDLSFEKTLDEKAKTVNKSSELKACIELIDLSKP